MADVEFSEEQQELVDKLVGSARVKAREQAQAEIEKAKEAAVEVALKEQGEWRTLAEKAQAKLEELEGAAERAEVYEGVIADMLESRVKELGEEAQAALDGLSLSAIEKLNWLNRNEGLFKVQSDGVGTPQRTQERGTEPAEGSVSRFPIRL
mgnify:CR=1 FL=1